MVNSYIFVVIGHQKQWQFLKKSAGLDKLSHAYLFSGQEKLGKRTLALELVKFLFGQDALNPPHPDFILVEPLGREIEIGQIRELNWKLFLKPFLAPLKIAIINEAHLINEAAQNCFLKTLEEPRGKALLILISEYPDSLLPTILSRVQQIKFYPVKKIEIDNYLKSQGLSEKKSKEIIEISMGRPGVAIDFVREPAQLEIYEQRIKDLIKISRSDLSSRFQYVKNLSKEENVSKILNIWLNYFRHILITQPNCDFPKLRDILNQIQNTIFLLSNINVNPRLSLEILMMEL